MADSNPTPPQAQKPLDEKGFFTSVWHRFFLKLYTQANKTNDVQSMMSTIPSSGGGNDSGSSSSGISTDDVQARLSFDNKSPDLTKRDEGIEARLLSINSSNDILSKIKDLEIQSLFHRKSNVPKKEMVLSDGTYTAGSVAVGGKVTININGTNYNMLVE